VDQLTVGIVGLGQIGGSIAASLKSSERHPRIIGFDIDSKLSDMAKEKRLIDEVCQTNVDLIENADIIVVSVPMFAILSFLRSNANALLRKSLIIDTGSTKQDVMSVAEKLKLTNLVGGHPYAGSEKSAPEAWASDLFMNQTFFLTEVPNGKLHSKQLARSFVESLGAVPQWIGPTQHDRMFAFASGLPHVIAYALVASQADRRRRVPVDEQFLAHSFASSTRVAKSNPGTVAEFLWQNRKELRKELATFKRKLDEIDSYLHSNSIDSLIKELNALKGIKDKLERQDGSIITRKHKTPRR